MLNRSTTLAVVGLTLTMAACGDDAEDDANLVARAGDYTLTVDQVVDLIADEERLPAQSDVVEALANIWIDYTLLGDAAARDTTFEDIDLRPLVDQRSAQTMLTQLRDSVIQVDTAVTDGELRAMYEAEAPDVRIRARHIMLTYPVQATAEQRDSVRAQLQALRDRVAGGASFEALARQFSQDPGSAPSGGDLGFFSRGEMVLPFEEAVMALEPGQVSEVVETPMGLHVIRLEERSVQDFATVAAQFRLQVQTERTAVAESTFVASLENRVGVPELTDDALDVARELARTPATRLAGRAARRPLLEWDGGAFTVRQLQLVLQLEQEGLRDQVANSSDEDLESFLKGLARRELLLDEARVSGLEPPRIALDSVTTEVAGLLRDAARRLGLMNLDQAPGEPVERAVSRAVLDALSRNITGATQVIPLGVIGFQLRSGSTNSISGRGVGRAILEVADRRADRSPSLLEESVVVPGDTSEPPQP